MMNKYAAAGLIEEARNGRTVLIVSHSYAASQEAFRMMADHAPDASRIMRSASTLAIEYPSGRVRLTATHGGAHRGVSADIVFIEHEADRYLSRDHYRDIAPIIATSPHGEIVRA